MTGSFSIELRVSDVGMQEKLLKNIFNHVQILNSIETDPESFTRDTKKDDSLQAWTSGSQH